jgi:hypothetical protein
MPLNACRTGHVETVEELITADNDAHLAATDGDSQTPLVLAIASVCIISSSGESRSL